MCDTATPPSEDDFTVLILTSYALLRQGYSNHTLYCYYATLLIWALRDFLFVCPVVLVSRGHSP